MANIKVSELNEATTINDEDLLMVVQGNESKKISIETLMQEITNCKTVTFNNEWRTATLPFGDYLKISIPILNPSVSTPTINITSAQIYNGANWVNLPLPQMDSKTTNEIILGFNYGVADGLTAGNCYLIRMTGTMSVN